MGRCIRRIGAFLRYSPLDRRLLLEAAAAQWAARIGLWLKPFPKLSARFEQRAVRRRRATPLAAADRWDWAVRGASSTVLGSNCLVRALALRYLLQRDGREAEVRIGVTKVGRERIDGHAWVEAGGETFLREAASGGHRALVRAPGSPAAL